MTQAFNVLIIDEQPLNIETYKSALIDLNKTLSYLVFNICTASSYELAMKKMKNATNKERIKQYSWGGDKIKHII